MHLKSADSVKFPQLRPHCFLEYNFVSSTFKYKDLEFRSFIAGELEILSSGRIGSEELKHRMANLKHIIYLENTYEWEALRDMHAAKLRLIERGI